MRKISLALALILLAIWVFGPGNDSLLPRLSEQDKILAFGDSLTQGVGASKGMDYPTQLQAMIGREVVNAGISGETTAQGLLRFTQVLDSVDPQLVILLEGGNDFLRNVPVEQVETNLSQMIALAQRRDIAVVLIAVPQKSIWLAPAELYRRLSEKYQLVFIEGFLTELLKLPEVKSDTIHLNDEGYRRLAQHLEQRLRDAGAL